MRYLFSSFEERYRLHEGHFDREVRRPWVTKAIWEGLGLSPDPARTCLVSGSKGKGTVARQIAWNLTRQGHRVGLLLSPEEIHHRDRIRVDNQPIPEADLCRILTGLAPALDGGLRAEGARFYFPPTAIFLLIALDWFRTRHADYLVIEGGRGVCWDEIGQLAASVGVLTNVLPEHLATLGPSLEDIVRDKLSLADRCSKLVVHPQVRQEADRLGLLAKVPNLQVARLAGAATTSYPAWFIEVDAVARHAFSLLSPNASWTTYGTPAFSISLLDGFPVVCDGAILADCIDTAFMRERGFDRGAALVGLSSAKDSFRVVERLRASGVAAIYGCRLYSPVGHIDTDWMDEASLDGTIGPLDIVQPDLAWLRHALSSLVEQHGSVYAVGIQVFCRSVRNALGLGVMEPGVDRYE